MITKEELSENVLERREELMRRADELRERFGENVNGQAVTGFVGWTLVSAGIAWGMTDWVRGRRTLQSLLLPMVMIVMGTSVLGGQVAVRRRSVHISEAEEVVREQLMGLDPFARMRVLREMTGETVPFVRRISTHN